MKRLIICICLIYAFNSINIIAQSTEPIKEYDEKGNLTHEETSDGIKKWYEYNEKGIIIHEKIHNPYEDLLYDYENWYDDKGHIIKGEGNNGVDYSWYKDYDEKGNTIRLVEACGPTTSETNYEYDVEGKVILKKWSYNSRGWSDSFKYWYEYDDKGNIIHEKNSYGFEWWNEYYPDGSIIGVNEGKTLYKKLPDNSEYWFDDKGNLIHKNVLVASNDWNEIWYEYDDKGNIVCEKEKHNFVKWFDNNGKVIHEKDPFGYEFWYEYNDKGNKIYEKAKYGLMMMEI